MNDLQSTRELAERRAREDAQIANLPALEAEQRQQERIEQAAYQAGILEVELATAVANLQPQKQQSDTEFTAWVREGKAILERRRQLGGGIFELASQLAHAQLSCGIKRSPLLREDAVRATAEETLKSLTGSSYPMPTSQLERDLRDILDSLTAPPQPTYYPMPETANQYRR